MVDRMESHSLCDVHVRQDHAFIEYSNHQDADNAISHLDGRDVDGRRITVEFAKGVPRGAGGVRESAGRGPTPGSGCCFNCGQDGHWARDCTAGDWTNMCYRCGKRGHIVKDCENNPKKLSYSRSPMRSRAPPRGRSRSRSFSKSRSHSYSRSSMRSRAPRHGRSRSRSFSKNRSPRRERSYSRSPMRTRSPRRGRRRRRNRSRSRSRSRSFSKNPSYGHSRYKRGRDVVYDERRSLSPIGVSSERKRRASPSKSGKHSSTPARDSARESGSRAPRKGEDETGQDGYINSPQEGPSPRRGRRERENNGYSDSPKETSGSPTSPATTRYETANGNNRSPSPIREDEWSPIRDDGNYTLPEVAGRLKQVV
ncbi:uncharacterized protein [Henckelia pumila]|uniref:uncharacterized protein isoform X3 n=1 Tax=Henckelia pumila TaxID=405737 RepID=UPI003C6E9541